MSVFQRNPLEWQWRVKGRDFTFHRSLMMGIVNVTPDSFSDGGCWVEPDAAVEHACRLIEDGADILDFGGESTRPGSEPVSEKEEIERVVPVIQKVRRRWNGLISIDTMKPGVAEAALKVGADIVNDVSGLRNEEMCRLVKETEAGVVVMHMQGEPKSMQVNPYYHEVLAEVRAFFETQARKIECFGISLLQVLWDPGIGFGKNLNHNLSLLRGVGQLRVLDRPLLVGVSRKRMISQILGSECMDERDWGTVALTSWLREEGVAVMRVHDVQKNGQALRMTEAILGTSSEK